MSPPRWQDRSIVWRACAGCRQEWPFPNPDAATSDDREWICPSCIEAAWAKAKRALAIHPERPQAEHWFRLGYAAAKEHAARSFAEAFRSERYSITFDPSDYELALREAIP